MATNDNLVVCDSYDRTLEKTRLIKNVITEFTGNPPKDYQHIHGVKTVIEKYPHPNIHSVPTSNTVPVGPGDVWEKMTDWDQLTPAEQNSVKNFLLERFAVDDLELAYDEFYPKFGKLPTVHDYRVFILNWEAQMKQDLETKDDSIQQLSNRESNLLLSLNHTVMHSVNQQDQINNLLGDNQSLQDENSLLTTVKNQLSNNNRQLQDDNRQLSSDNSNKDKTLAQQVRVNSYLRRDVATRDATIEQKNALCSELKTKTKQLKAENTDLKTENTQKDGTISQLQTDNTQLQTDNTQLQTENTQKDGTISQLQTDNTQQVSKIKNLNSETKNLKKDNILLYQKLQETTEICEHKDRQLRIQKIKVDELQYQMSETGDRIARLEKVNEDKCDEINRLIGNNDEQAQHIREQNSTIDDLRHRLQEQESINRDLYSQIAELRQLVLAQIGAAEE
ncbi:uncharacterized protein LOC127703179 isoform X2 [Mytilus californianus]|uniref:uncharacterized protein LOC127703179 isoform X2 n=1 Tax=Mytilus californianus TaxID=6549 RepID=UPI0022458C4B|nr:uncharacterized protein LOC127703179 isoform X2 [Mytilus californianus]